MSLHGDSFIYRNKYHLHIIFQRVSNIYSTIFAVKQGHIGFSCLHDCGPHASCRCGNCVDNTDTGILPCKLPDCDECKKIHYHILRIGFVIVMVLTAQLVYSVLRILLAKNRRTRRQVQHFCGLNCCLCDEKLYMIRSRRGGLTKYLPWYYYSPCGMLIFSLLSFVICVVILYMLVKDMLSNIFGIIPEELNISDHLLIHAQLTYRN